MRTPNQRWVQAASIRLFHRLFHMRIFCCMRTPNQRRVQAVLSNQRVALEGAYDVAEVPFRPYLSESIRPRSVSIIA